MPLRPPLRTSTNISTPLLFQSRPTIPASAIYTQQRHATLLRRPRRPYTFTQLLTLSDGSVTITRTTSPLPIYKSTKDTRNHPMWNPSSLKLANVEEDEAGRLRAFRRRFGRGWDAESTSREGEEDEADPEDALIDLIGGFRVDDAGSAPGGAAGSGKGRAKSG